MPDTASSTAAHLYILSLDGPARAWEYLRRNRAYRRAWASAKATNASAAQPWGLRFP